MTSGGWMAAVGIERVGTSYLPRFSDDFGWIGRFGRVG